MNATQEGTVMPGLYIQQQRVALGLAVKDVATDLGLTVSDYKQVERSVRKLTKVQAKKLAQLFYTEPDDFHAHLEGRAEAEAKAKGLDIYVIKTHPQKFKNVLLYVLNKVGAKPNVNESVLHKLLYFIDFDHYEKFDENLMGATYIKSNHGPTVLDFASTVKAMQKRGELMSVTTHLNGLAQKKYLPLQQPDLTLLSARDVAHIDGVLSRLADMNATEIERYSHEDTPWIIAMDRDAISYHSVFYRGDAHSVRVYDDEL